MNFTKNTTIIKKTLADCNRERTSYCTLQNLNQAKMGSQIEMAWYDTWLPFFRHGLTKFIMQAPRHVSTYSQWWVLWGAEPSQTCSAPPPGTMLGWYKISLMSSYLELGHARATWKARWRGRRVYIVHLTSWVESGVQPTQIALEPISEDLESKQFSGGHAPRPP